MEEIFKGISLENCRINPRASLARAAFKRDFLDNHGGRRSIAGTAECKIKKARYWYKVPPED